MRTPPYFFRLTAIAVLTVALTGQIPAGAGTSVLDPPTTPPPQATVTAPHQVTLITGDVVTLTGKHQFAVDPAERPDGRQMTFTGRTGATINDVQDLYVIPSDVADDPRLDLELFNVTGLIREGLDRAGELPILVENAPLTRSVRGAKAAPKLPDNGLTPMKVQHSAPGEFWQRLPKNAKVWLNHRREVSLDVSVPQIGAPEAWAAGFDGTGVTVAVIDTGIDHDHPDLADQIVAAQDFTYEGDPDDFYGHGTHVASTIAGSGAASDSRYTGVAPGAKLINAKACSSDGYCYDDWIMAAMNYAADSGAKIINMSLGGGISDGSDPLSQEVNRLTEETGALFVIAAGNSGDYPITVGAPGAADAALTVGAVDREDKLAWFSSRGPRYLDAAIKPDLTAPGVGIVAARADGTSMGSPVDEHYTASSGTSMATPQVAGAAAILAQQHEDWTAEQLKDALVSTAVDTPAGITEEGAGRVDVARAYGAQLTGEASVDFGRLFRRTLEFETITYRNDGDKPVLLRLKLRGTGWNGDRIPFLGALVTPLLRVPAHGSADATVLVNTYLGEPGSYAAMVTATGLGRDGDIQLRTPLSYYIEPPAHQLTAKLIDPAGEQVVSHSGIFILRDDFDPEHNNDPFAQLFFWGERHENGDVTAEVPVGSYSLLATHYVEPLTEQAKWYGLTKVDVQVRDATTVRLDTGTAEPISVAADAKANTHFVSLGRTVPGGAGFLTGCNCLGAQAYVTPTPEPAFGHLSMQDSWTFAEQTTWLRAGDQEVHPVHEAAALAAAFPGEQSVPVVFAGDGSDFSGIEVAGKLALVALPVAPDAPDPLWDAYVAAAAASRNAAAAGAAGVATYIDVEGAVPVFYSYSPIPYLGFTQTEGSSLGTAGALEISTKANPEFIYNLHYSAPNGISDDLSHVVDPAALTRVDTEYHADLPDLGLMRAWYGFRKDAPGTVVTPRVNLDPPLEIAEYVGGSPDAIENVDWTRVGVLHDDARNGITQYNRLPFAARDVFFAGPTSPGGFDPAYRAFYRLNLPGQAQLLRPSQFMGDGSPGHILDVDYGGYRATSYRLFRDGVEVPPQWSGFSSFPTFAVPDEAAEYRLDAVTVLPDTGVYGPSKAMRRLSHRVDTSWTFRSDRGSPQPCYPGALWECKDESLLQPFYDLGLDLYNNAPAGPHSFAVEVQRTDIGQPAALSSLAVSYSADEGATWRDAVVTPLADGRYTVTVDNPDSGFVWLRVSAAAADGASVIQTVQRIYGIA